MLPMPSKSSMSNKILNFVVQTRIFFVFFEWFNLHFNQFFFFKVYVGSRDIALNLKDLKNVNDPGGQLIKSF